MTGVELMSSLSDRSANPASRAPDPSGRMHDRQTAGRAGRLCDWRGRRFGLNCWAMSLPISIHRLRPDVALPEYQTNGSAGFDLAASIEMTISPGEVALVPTGLVVT